MNELVFESVLLGPLGKIMGGRGMFNTLSPPCLRPRYTNIPPPPRCKGGFQPQETLSKSLPPVDKGLKVGIGGAYLDQVALERTSSTLAYKGEAPKPEPEAYMNTN